jgi:putative ABC transport system substrate-binding protein
VSYTQDARESFHRVADDGDTVRHGAKPAAVPVEQPMKYSLASTLKTASALGRTLPPGHLVLADGVLQ